MNIIIIMLDYNILGLEGSNMFRLPRNESKPRSHSLRNTPYSSAVKVLSSKNACQV